MNDFDPSSITLSSPSKQFAYEKLSRQLRSVMIETH